MNQNLLRSRHLYTNVYMHLLDLLSGTQKCCLQHQVFPGGSKCFLLVSGLNSLQQRRYQEATGRQAEASAADRRLAHQDEAAPAHPRQGNHVYGQLFIEKNPN